VRVIGQAIYYYGIFFATSSMVAVPESQGEKSSEEHKRMHSTCLFGSANRYFGLYAALNPYSVIEQAHVVQK